MSVDHTRLAVLAFIAIAVAAGQDRTAEIERAREQKAAHLRPEKVSSPENVMLQVKQRKVLERLTAGYNGLRFTIGGMATGSGIAAGPDFLREDLAGGRIRINAAAILSTRQWQKYQAGVSLPHLADDHLSIGLEAVRRDYRSLEFYGPGPDSSRSDRTTYRLEDTNLEATAAAKFTRRVRFGTSLGGLWADVRPGRREDLASTDTIFDDRSAPGLASQANFLHSSVFGQYDWRDDPLGPKAGGNYVSEYSWYSDQSLGAFSFRRWDVDLQQYIPFFNKTRRIALRARMTMTDPVSGNRMPFYMQPYLGGSDDLRGFRPYRFTDRNAVVYNAEYRWEIFSGLDGALFFDAGKVMPHRGYLSVSDLEVSSGFGLRFNAANRTFLRLDVGVSHEGAVLWIKFNDPFLPRLFGAGTRQPLY